MGDDGPQPNAGVVVDEAPVPVEAGPDGGSKVRTNGEWIDAGMTTGTPSTVTDTARVPSSKWVVPVAGMSWLPPACMVPVHSVEPVDAVVALTQHGPEVERFTWKGDAVTLYTAVLAVDDRATSWAGAVVEVVGWCPDFLAGGLVEAVVCPSVVVGVVPAVVCRCECWLPTTASTANKTTATTATAVRATPRRGRWFIDSRAWRWTRSTREPRRLRRLAGFEAVPRPGVVEDQWGPDRLDPHRGGGHPPRAPGREARWWFALFARADPGGQRAGGIGATVEPRLAVPTGDPLVGGGDVVGGRPDAPLREVLERPEGRVVVPHRAQVLGTRTAQNRHGGHDDRDQRRHSQDVPHAAHSTRTAGRLGSGRRRPARRAHPTAGAGRSPQVRWQ